MKFLLGLVAIAVGCGGSTLRVDPFVGDWKLNPAKSTYIDVMKVQSVNGATYTFDFGGAGETIAVDGTDQPGVSGTTLAVSGEDATHWSVVRKQDGRIVIHAKWELAPDGKTLHDDFTQFAPDGQVATHGNFVYHRTADGSGFAGTWERTLPTEELPPTTLQIRPYDANGLSLAVPSINVIRNVKFDGKDYPVAGRGAAEGSTSSGRRVDQRTLDLTDKSKGEVRRTQHIEVSPDSKTLTQTLHPVGQKEANVFVFERS